MGMPVPDAIDDKPEVDFSLSFYWYAFWELSTDRQIGMNEGPIPWSAMDRWATRHAVEGEEFDRLVIMMKSLDSVYLQQRSKKHKQSIAAAGKKQNTSKQDKGFMKSKSR